MVRTSTRPQPRALRPLEASAVPWTVTELAAGDASD